MSPQVNSVNRLIKRDRGVIEYHNHKNERPKCLQSQQDFSNVDPSLKDVAENRRRAPKKRKIAISKQEVPPPFIREEPLMTPELQDEP